MVKIRLARYGSKKHPVYRVVVCDERAPRDGRFIERVGFFNPHIDTDAALQLNLERVQHWIKNGAQPTDKVKSLIARLNKAVAAA